MSVYVDGFVLPIQKGQMDTYQNVVKQVAEIWKEHGALEYTEHVGDDLDVDGMRSFNTLAKAQADEVVIFGWVVFESRAERDRVNERVINDPRMAEIVSPLTEGHRPVFDAQRMAYGGFKRIT